MRHRARLYLITPPKLDPEAFAPLMAEALAGGDIAAVQLRLKDVSDDAVLHAGAKLRDMVQHAHAAFLINDRPDLAVEIGADGVHVGQGDAPYAEARRIVGKEAIVGVTAHNSRHLAMEAAEAGADYVAFGAFFPTDTKQPSHWCEPEVLEIWHETTETASIAIGGLKLDNCEPIVRANPDFIAVSSAVWNDPRGPRAAVADFNALFDRLAHAGGE
ncbi:MAG: thiamine phosphate synthase [Hyphomonadaceae bacterium]|nr:thiamine phosphate synthase [Hyphomonadaceae bacterium]